MKRSSLALITLFCTLTLSAGEKVKTPIPNRTECLSLFKQALTDIKDDDQGKVFSYVLDSSGGKSFQIVTDRSMEDVEKVGVKNFMKKNFPNNSLILNNYDKIEFSKLEQFPNQSFSMKEDDKVLGEVNLYYIKVKMPFLKDNMVGSISLNLYSYLRFVKFKGKLYWVPFGW